MINALLLYVSIMQGNIIDCPLAVVSQSVDSVLCEKGFEITHISKCEIAGTKVLEDAGQISQYIIENWFDENPGWTKARIMVSFMLQVVDERRSVISLKAKFERFGTPNKFLLIPPIWVESPTNGEFEKILLNEIIMSLKSMMEEK